MREINLLPPDRRNKLRKQWLGHAGLQALKHVQVALGLVAILGLITGGALQVSLLVASTKGEGVLTSLVSRYQRERQQIIQKNQVLQEITTTSSERIVWSDNLSDLLGVIPPGTTVRAMQSIANPARLTFSGQSVNRNSLIILQTRLEQFEWAQSVTSPLQNLLDRENPEYSFTITVKEPGE